MAGTELKPFSEAFALGQHIYDALQIRNVNWLINGCIQNPCSGEACVLQSYKKKGRALWQDCHERELELQGPSVQSHAPRLGWKMRNGD